MVIYEREHDWIMIPQHYHGLLSGDIARYWNSSYSNGMERWEEVIYAIAQHDRAWISLDNTPFWNDRDNRPYSFIDFPSVPKLIFYQKGIDEVEKHSLYAGLLCSLHYQSFMIGAKDPASIEFTRQEKNRQQRIKEQLNLNEAEKNALLKFHFLMVQFCDDLSLYLCMQEPGTPKDDEFPWFKDGFQEIFPFLNSQPIIAEWLDAKQVSVTPSPLASPAVLSIKLKEVMKKDIALGGIAKAYQNSEWKVRTFTLI